MLVKFCTYIFQIGSKRCWSTTESDCLIPQLGSGPDTSTSGSRFLTIEDYKEILLYAKTRHIEVIPEIGMPGHARAAIIAMEGRYRKLLENGSLTDAEQYRLIDPNDMSRYLSVQYFNDNAMSPCLESTFTFMEKVFKEIKAMHDSVGCPLETFHFGGDEVAKNAWSNSSTCTNSSFTGTYSDRRTSMKKYFLERVSNITHSYGVNLAGWEDGFIEGNGIPYNRSLLANTEVISNAWNNVWEWGEARRAYNFANSGYKV